jgi:hypothetical protein
MRPGVKAAVVLLVSLPILAYVTGRLAAVPPDPAPRSPVILESPAARTPSPSPASTPVERDDGDQRGEGDDVRVVNPTPTRVGEDEGEDGLDNLNEDRDEDGEPEGDDRTDDDSASGDD